MISSAQAVRAPATDVTAAVVTQSRDIARFERAWQELFRRPGTEPSTSFEWTSAMLRYHVAEVDRFFLVQLSRGGETIGFVPLVARAERILGQRLLTLAPLADRYCTHGSILGLDLDADAMGAVLDVLLGLDVKWDVFRMSKLLDTSPLPDMIGRVADERGLHSDIRFTRPAYFIDLPATFDAYLAARTPKFRQNLRRTEKKLEAIGRVVVTVVRDERGFDHAYDALLRIERESWKHAHGTAISAVPRQTAFYRAMGLGAAISGRLDLQILTLDGTPIAHNLGYTHNGCYYYLKTSYDERQRALSPATYLRARLIADLIAAGVRVMDFHGEPYEWERLWSDTYRWHRSLMVYNGTLKGHLVRWFHRLKRNDSTPPSAPVFVDPLANTTHKK